MTSVGETLRRERIRRNLDLDQISRETKIAPRLLEAIEDERFDKLPGGVFARSFVRQYARFLGLDEDELVGEVDRVLNPAPPAAEAEAHAKKAPPPLPRVEEWQTLGESNFKWTSSLPALAGVVMVMLACSLVYNWWQNRRARPAPPQIHAAQQEKAAPAAPVTTTATPAPSVPQQPAESAEPAPVEQPAEAARSAAPPESSPTAASRDSAAPPQPAATPAAPNPNAAVRLEISAQEPTWVSVRTDGKYLFSGTLQPGESRRIEAGENATIRFGNAGGVAVIYNGKPIGPVGPKGQPRTVQFTPAGMQAAPSTPAAPKAPATFDPL